MIEIAYDILKAEKSTLSYNDLLNRVVELKGMTEQERERRISYLYTNLNVDGRFVCLGDNMWGLRTWYLIEKLEEDIITAKPARKKGKATLDDEEDVFEEDFEEYEEDEFEDLEDELDELSDEEDQDEFEDEDLDGFNEEEDSEEEEEFDSDFEEDELDEEEDLT